jgi:hypothetical protein
VVATAALVGGLVAGGASWTTGTPGRDPERVPRSLRVVAPEQEAPRAEATAPTVRSARVRPPPPDTPPTWLGIEAVGLSLPVLPMGVDRKGLMALPPTPLAASWYRYGADPTDRRGAVVVSGHVDTEEDGAGPLARLAGLAEGTEIVLDHRGGSTTYSVVAVREVAKSLLDLPALFRRSGPPRLHLVTCGGAFLPDRGGYQDNVVVVAEPER